MTVIAWDGERLAADKQATNAGLRRTVTKIMRHNGELFGISGDPDKMLQVQAWYIAGADPDKFPADCRTADHGSFVVIDKRKRLLMFSSGPYPSIYEDEKTAIGSGRDYALAAMYCGKNAAEAVEIASQFDNSCGRGVDVLFHPLAEDSARLGQPLPMTESSQDFLSR